MKERKEKPNQRKKEDLSTAKEIKKKRKRQPTDWEKMAPQDASDKEPLFKIHNEPLKFNNKRANTPETISSPKKMYRWQISM